MKIGLGKEEIYLRIRNRLKDKNILSNIENVINEVAIVIEENNEKVEKDIENIIKEHTRINNCSVH